MSTRELVFEYTTKGARAAARADSKVRDSVRKTGRTAERNAGSVQRWLDRSRKAIQLLAAASLAAVGAILSASPTMRAQLSGVRTAFTLFSETIVQDLLPGSESLARTAVDLAQSYRDLDDDIRPIISTFIAIAGVMGFIAVVATGKIALVVGIFLGLVFVVYRFLDALLDLDRVLSGFRKLIAAVGALLRGDFSEAADLARDGLRDLWLAGQETREKVMDAIRGLVNGAIDRLTEWYNRATELATDVRDGLVEKITDAKDRVLELLSLGREMAGKAKEWIGGLVDGVQDRAGDLVDAFRDMASRVAQAFRDRFNDIIPSSISIPSVSINIPDILGGGRRTFGGGSLSLPQLDTGGRIASDGLAMLHAGERIMPAAQVRERGPQPTGEGGTRIEEINIVVTGTGDARTDGRNIAREFERELSDRGA